MLSSTIVFLPSSVLLVLLLVLLRCRSQHLHLYRIYNFAIVNMLAPNSGIFTFMANDVLISQNVNQLSLSLLILASACDFLTVSLSLLLLHHLAIPIPLYIDSDAAAAAVCVYITKLYYFRRHCRWRCDTISKHGNKTGAATATRAMTVPLLWQHARLREWASFVQIFMWRRMCQKFVEIQINIISFNWQGQYNTNFWWKSIGHICVAERFTFAFTRVCVRVNCASLEFNDLLPYIFAGMHSAHKLLFAR